ncbi:hypothetical protein AB1L30_17675 [Bremerella sp. JC817]|uniref:hypothetical protein n=1 Tax=Bremerella sp. JC817 TaxID=3231756 RepID=UPI00345A3439
MTTENFQIRQLADELQPPETGKNSIVLSDDDNTKVVLFAFAADDGVAEHVAPMPAIIQIIKGEASLTVGEETIVGKPGTWIQMAANTPHSIKPQTPVVMSLMLLKQHSKLVEKKVYDHNTKAGNHGDIVKHVALTAAIRCALESFNGEVFRYADTFAGYAWNPLNDDKGLEWKQGIGELIKRRERFGENPDIKHWANSYLIDDELAGTQYPGSSVLVRDILKARGVGFTLSLWDTGDDPVASLKVEFEDDATIYQRPARPDEDAVLNADVLFIDPPGLKTKGKREYPSWQEIKAFLPSKDSPRLFMMWLPIKAVTMRDNIPLKPPGEDSLSDTVRNELTELGFTVLKVRYLPSGRTIGCQIIHNFTGDAARQISDAVSTAIEIAGWQDKLPTGMSAISAYGKSAASVPEI